MIPLQPCARARWFRRCCWYSGWPPALGLYIFFTERGVANEIKGFVLLLIAAVLMLGGFLHWELREIRKRLDKKDS